MKILVVDDEKLVIKGIQFNLEHEGYEVIVGYDGESAVSLARSEQPDLVILDLMMPKIDGLQRVWRSAPFPTCLLSCLPPSMEKKNKSKDWICK